MKLRMITELYNKQHADGVALNQTLKNLQVSALTKLRNMLASLGLVKNPNMKNSVPEPIGPAIGPFDRLRQIVKTRLSRDLQHISMLGDRDLDRINRYWGFSTPNSWMDHDSGSSNIDGTFDQYLFQIVKDGQGLPVEGKVKLLQSLADTIAGGKGNPS